MVIIFRCTLADSTPVEKFSGFQKPSDHHIGALSGCIKNVLHSVLKNSDQLISRSYDGASVISHTSNKFNLTSKMYKYIYTHFFADLSKNTNFVSNSPQRVSILEGSLEEKIRMHLLQGGIIKLELLILFMKTQQALWSVRKNTNIVQTIGHKSEIWCPFKIIE